MKSQESPVPGKFFSHRVLPIATVVWLLAGCGSTSQDLIGPSSDNGGSAQPPTATSLIVRQDILVNADIWDRQPKIFAANTAVIGAVGIPGMTVDDLVTTEQLVRDAGGNWSDVFGVDPTLGSYTSSPTPERVASAYGYPVEYADGLPIVFSWPVRPSTVHPQDFLFTLSDGTTSVPYVAAAVPNYDYNERSTVVVYGKFGNRLAPGTEGAVHPVRLDIVGDLELVGPGPTFVNATGMSVQAGTAYGNPDDPPEQRRGPRLVAAKLTRMSAVGDQAPAAYASASPNDGITLYGGQAQYRLRMYTSGGFSPNGVQGLRPDQYSQFFRVRAGDQMLEQTGVPYDLGVGTVTVVGLAELGRLGDQYDDTYVEDQDNQIDVILSGDEEAIRLITAVDVPSLPPYSPFYNPGGPGNSPTQGVRYTSPSPPHSQTVWMALDEETTVTYIAPGLTPDT